jgi:hypothetical protein
MPEEETISVLLADLSTKLKEIDERNRILKERISLLSQTFLKREDRNNKEFAFIKEELNSLRLETGRLKEAVQHIISESAGFARKEELKVIERYAKMFEPVKFVKPEEVKEMIKEELKKKR